MLVACTENKEPFVIHSKISHATLRRIKEEKNFFCPQCGEMVQLKIGNIKIPHFAHYSKSRCESHFSEGETVEHLSGKQQLFELFKSLQLHAELEPYLKELKQRPDLLIFKNGSAYAIEFQCSPINENRFFERNRGYLQKRIAPIWIPLTPGQKIKETPLQKINLSHQLQLFIAHAQKPKYLMTYDPANKQFVYLSNLIHFKGISFFGKVSRLPLFKQHFPFYIPKTLTKDEFSFVFKAYHHFIKQFLKSRVLVSRKGVNDLFLRSVYELRLNPGQLPTFLGVPISGNEALQACAVEWQTELLYFIRLNGIKVHAVNEQMIKDFFQWSGRADTDGAVQTVFQYVELLNELAIEDEKCSVEERQLEEVLYSQFLATTGKY